MEARLALIREALAGTSKQDANRLIRTARKDVEPVPAPATDPAAHLKWQIEEAIKRDIHRLYGKTEEEFSNFLAPLVMKARDLPTVKAPALPSLLVFPTASLHGRTAEQRRRLLFQTLRFRGKRFEIKWSLKALDKDRFEVPHRPYLAVNVEIGAELASILAEEGAGNSEEFFDPAVLQLASVRRDPLTLDEGLILSSVFEGEVRHLTGLRLPGTLHSEDNNCPLLDYGDEGEGPYVDDMQASDIGDSASDWYKIPYAVPSCAERIGF
ncbi:MAG: hypothetical protein Q8Q36_00915 [bacterium]|nr:hypothetical protein [bacterium]